MLCFVLIMYVWCTCIYLYLLYNIMYFVHTLHMYVFCICMYLLCIMYFVHIVYVWCALHLHIYFLCDLSVCIVYAHCCDTFHGYLHVCIVCGLSRLAPLLSHASGLRIVHWDWLFRLPLTCMHVSIAHVHIHGKILTDWQL
jgi:hypothetical protein